MAIAITCYNTKAFMIRPQLTYPNIFGQFWITNISKPASWDEGQRYPTRHLILIRALYRPGYKEKMDGTYLEPKWGNEVMVDDRP